MLVDLINTTCFFAIEKETVDKTTLNETTGEYVPTSETRDQNVIVKVFHDPSKVTVVEQREAVKANTQATPVYYDKWLEKNKGQTRNRTHKAGDAAKNNRPGASNQAPTASSVANAPKKTSSLFQK